MYKKKRPTRKLIPARTRQAGQAAVEYTLLLLILAGLFAYFFGRMPELLTALENPIRKDFKYAYKYGDKRARGFDDEDEGPKFHPRIYVPGNFKLFARGEK